LPIAVTGKPFAEQVQVHNRNHPESADMEYLANDDTPFRDSKLYLELQGYFYGDYLDNGWLYGEGSYLHIREG
jgi:hypothetical protein